MSGLPVCGLSGITVFEHYYCAVLQSVIELEVRLPSIRVGLVSLWHKPNAIEPSCVCRTTSW